MIIIIGRAEVDPVKAAALKPALAEMMRATFEESGCLSYSLAMEDDGGDGRPAILSIAERWESEAALKAHFASPHMAAFNAAAAGAMLSLDVRMYEVTNERPLKMS